MSVLVSKFYMPTHLEFHSFVDQRLVLQLLKYAHTAYFKAAKGWIDNFIFYRKSYLAQLNYSLFNK